MRYVLNQSESHGWMLLSCDDDAYDMVMGDLEEPGNDDDRPEDIDGGEYFSLLESCRIRGEYDADYCHVVLIDL